MEKNRIRPMKSGRSSRMTYSRQKEVLQMPNLIEVQKDSYQWFLDEGLKEVFDDISPITDYSGQLSLEFVDFTLCEDDVKYTIEECKERDATYAAPLKVRVRLYNKDQRARDLYGRSAYYDKDRHLCYQWCGTCYRKPACAFPWYLLRNRAR